jgi:hypothetical protein
MAYLPVPLLRTDGISMKLVFIFGPAASGKLTVARELSALTGLPLFHNHLVVDAVAAVFPFGAPEFVRLREQMWMAMFEEAARARRSLSFTFAPEPTVPEDFPERVRRLVASHGGEVAFIRLEVARDIQEARIGDDSRRQFGKLVSLDLLRELQPVFEACEAKMPAPILTIDTGSTPTALAALQIAERLGLSTLPSGAGAA